MDFIRQASLVVPPPVTTKAILDYVKGIYAHEIGDQAPVPLWDATPTAPQNVKDFPIDIRGWKHSKDFKDLIQGMSEWPATRLIRVMWNPSTDDISQLAVWDTESKTLMIQYQLPEELGWAQAFQYGGREYQTRGDAWSFMANLHKAIDREVNEAMIQATQDMFNVASQGYQWGLPGKRTEQQHDPELDRYLDPAMFYPLLKNEIDEFRNRTRHLRREIIGGTHQSEYRYALNIFIGNKKGYQLGETIGGQEWEYPQSPFFVALKNNTPELWRKAVAELVRRVPPPAESRSLRYRREEAIRRKRLAVPPLRREQIPGKVPHREVPEEDPWGLWTVPKEKAASLDIYTAAEMFAQAAKIPKDDRDFEWSELEADIQDRGKNKDDDFHPKGEWKKFVRNQDGFKVYAVDGKWVRDNLSVIFGHGGHGYVHEFIPLDEIWCGTHHWDENEWSKCDCDKGNEPVSKEYFDSCVAHEIAEFEEMKNDGEPYWPSHQKALDVEEELGLLKDPEGDSGDTELPKSWV